VQQPGPTTPPAPHLKQSRGGVVLALGILSIVLGGGCGIGIILGIIAWIMGNNDLKEIDQGTMDPSGRGTVQAGKICGVIGTILGGLYIVIGLIYVLFVFVILAAGAASNP